MMGVTVETGKQRMMRSVGKGGLVVLVALGISGCQATKRTDAPAPVMSVTTQSAPLPLNFSQRHMHSGYAQSPSMVATVGMIDTPSILSTDGVQVFPLDGAISNPFNGTRPRTVAENTTSGGYPVLDKNVTVFPLEGDTRPQYLSDFVWPSQTFSQRQPFEQRTQAMTQQDIENGFARPASNLPPIVEAPKLSMPAPSQYQQDKPSPFTPEGAFKPVLVKPKVAMTSYSDDADKAFSPRRGGIITGYDSDNDRESYVDAPMDGFEEEQVIESVVARPPAPSYDDMVSGHVAEVEETPRAVVQKKTYQALSQRAGRRSANPNLKDKEPVALYRSNRGGTSAADEELDFVEGTPDASVLEPTPAPLAPSMMTGY